ncbi:MAG: phospho-N-acetylmuramoyl-pentapeptide-transferase [Alphaproteobacteria bacterium]|nr:phospho-N-acetylmuramoyl-pentapeptide-transferase [Rickettsiales bacterium]
MVSNIISFNALYLAATFFTSFTIGIIAIPRFTSFLKNISFSQTVSFYINNIGDHCKKSKTPPMGGIVILSSSFFAFFLFYHNYISSVIVLITCTGLCFGLLGFIDDYKKITSKQHFGLLIKIRLLAEIIIAVTIVAITNYLHGNNPEYANTLIIGNYKINSFIFYSFVRVFAIVGSANGINITDGLDGLAAFPSFLCFVFFAFFSFIISVNPNGFVSYQSVYDANMITPFCIALCGGILSFLWFNVKPAKIFMGDTGSLSLGGMLGAIAVIIKAEFLLVILGSVFVIETISCILQIASFKLFGKRIFLIAPIHHHFEKKGLAEITIVARAWVFSIISFIVALVVFAIS